MDEPAWKPDEGVDVAAPRIARAWLGGVLASLGVDRKHRVDVHAARKGGKRVRSLLRLVRSGLGESTFRRDDERLRDAMRPLAELRDGDAALEALDALVEHAGAAAPASAVGRLRATLRSRRRRAARAASRAAAVAAAAAAVYDARKSAKRWAFGAGGSSLLVDGVRRVYARARKARGAALAALDMGDGADARTLEAMHAWRKRVKNLQHTLELIAISWPRVLAALAAEADRLADALGDDRDLAALAHVVGPQREPRGHRVADRQLLDAIAARRRELQAAARALAARLFAERPRAFAQRVEAYWRAWRDAPDAPAKG